MKIKAKVWIPSNPIVIGAKQIAELKGKKRRTMLDIRVPQKVFEVDCDGDPQYDRAMGMIRAKIKEAVRGSKDYGILIC